MAGGGGGAWKVAYADFVTAMMALFMVLWILTQDEKVKGNVQDYFRTRFKSVTKQSVGIIPIENADLIQAKRAHFDNASVVPLEHIRRINEDLLKVFVQNKDIIDMKTMRMQMTSEGLLIDFFNNPSKRLFSDGQSELTEYGRLLFGIVAWTLSKNQNSSTLLELEGHTGRKFEAKTTNADDDKWSISTQRALTVRWHMKKEGVKEEQFNKMVGYADTRPLKKSFADLDHPYHNRVSIMVRAGTAR